MYLINLSDYVEEGSLAHDVAAPVEQALLDPAVQELPLQLLTTSAMVMQKLQQHSQQQHLHCSRPQKASSSRRSSRRSSSHTDRDQQLFSDLLPVPAFHQDMLALLPGGQAYLDAAELLQLWRSGAAFCSTIF
jgi:hypothetical protein